jgi:hypothetical protein
MCENPTGNIPRGELLFSVSLQEFNDALIQVESHEFTSNSNAQTSR